MIQDIIFGVGSIIFCFALLPSVFGKNKPEVKTSLTTGIVLSVFFGTYLSIDYYFAAAVTYVTAMLWYILAAQKLMERNNGR